jgi:hypothetical protein
MSHHGLPSAIAQFTLKEINLTTIV